MAIKEKVLRPERVIQFGEGGFPNRCRFRYSDKS